VLRPWFCEPVKAKVVPEGKRELLTGLFGHNAVHLPLEHEIELKLFGLPTKPDGIGVGPHIMLPSSITSTAIATPDAAND
jgi:hypothetical protein